MLSFTFLLHHKIRRHGEPEGRGHPGAIIVSAKRKFKTIFINLHKDNLRPPLMRWTSKCPGSPRRSAPRHDGGFYAVREKVKSSIIISNKGT